MPSKINPTHPDYVLDENPDSKSYGKTVPIFRKDKEFGITTRRDDIKLPPGAGTMPPVGEYTSLNDLIAFYERNNELGDNSQQFIPAKATTQAKPLAHGGGFVAFDRKNLSFQKLQPKFVDFLLDKNRQHFFRKSDTLYLNFVEFSPRHFRAKFKFNKGQQTAVIWLEQPAINSGWRIYSDHNDKRYFSETWHGALDKLLKAPQWINGQSLIFTYLDILVNMPPTQPNTIPVEKPTKKIPLNLAAIQAKQAAAVFPPAPILKPREYNPHNLSISALEAIRKQRR